MINADLFIFLSFLILVFILKVLSDLDRRVNLMQHKMDKVSCVIYDADHQP